MSNPRLPAHPSPRRQAPRLIALAILLALAVARTAPAQVAAPGDVYYDVHLDHTFKYGPFVDEIVTWQNDDYTGTDLAFTAARDTVVVGFGSSSIATTVAATGGSLRAELSATLDGSARTGAFFYDTNRLTVDVYVRAPTGTPYRVVAARDGALLASRLNGLPGSLQPVNGISYVAFGDSSVTVGYTGTVAKPVFSTVTYAGVTTTAIVIGGETFSRAGTYALNALSRVTQTICILGCMTAAADFAAHASGSLALDVYLCDGATGLPCGDVPTSAPDVPGVAGLVRLDASPNPFNPRTELRFTGLPGRPTVLEIFDARGALVRRLFHGAADGSEVVATWDAGDAASGLYVARLRSGTVTTQRKLLLLR
jgi:hypothetical protein